MRTKMLLIALAATMLLIPTLASATHFVEAQPGADCYGWTADVSIRWRAYPEHVFEGTLSYVVTLEDMDGNVLETFNWSGLIDRPEPSYYVQHYTFGADWTVFAPAGSYMVNAEFTIEAPWSGGTDVRTLTFSQPFECDTVPTQETSWTAVKSLFD